MSFLTDRAADQKFASLEQARFLAWIESAQEALNRLRDELTPNMKRKDSLEDVLQALSKTSGELRAR